MYDERKERFSIRDLIIQVLFVAVFVFLLLWLFPMKGDVKNSVAGSVKETIAPLYDQIFNQNVTSMKEAAISYYTTPRLPKNVGDEEKMTLGEMLSENIILPFVDSKGKQCDLNESYVSITKMNDEYIMKINLKCSNQEDYLLVHLGCYNYCDGDVCEKKEETTTTTKPKTTVPARVTTRPVQTTTTTTTKPVDKYAYEYVRVINGKWGDYSNWSEWTTNVINKTSYRDVETKTETEITYKTEQVKTYEDVYETKTVQTGTKEEAYTAYKTVPVYETKTVQTGTKQEAYTAYRTVPVYTTQTVQTGTKQEAYTAYRTVPSVYGLELVQTGTKQVAYTAYKTVPVYETVQTGTKEEAYTVTEKRFVKMEYSLDCEKACTRVEQPVYENVQVTKYRTVPVYETKQTGTKEEAYTAYKTVPVYETKTVVKETKQEAYTAYRTVPVYETKTVQTGTKEEAYTAYRTVPVYETKTVQTGTKKEAYTAYKTVPVYETKKVKTGTKEVITEKKVPVEKTVTYYRSRTREYISGKVETVWSESNNDQKLISQGYALTGNTKKI